ncbi:tRNA modification GTPase [Flavobacteriaceae bacterium KMM 6897]|nr:tRNA modification GTPase [Flavobacteriaceae bacterium KMM 6897]
MKKKILLTFIFISLNYLNCFSQITFEKGYYINNSDQKIDCLIKKTEELNSPNKIVYKLSDNIAEETIGIESVKEFGIYNTSKYIRSFVKIDRSSDDTNRLSEEKEAILKEEQLFLMVLVQGKANLYFYKDRNLNRYFFNIDNSDIEQLIYKRYKITNFKIGENNKFEEQLWDKLNCPNVAKDIINIKYRKNKLVKIFVKYNKCNPKAELVNFQNKRERDFFNLNFRLGIKSSSLLVQHENPNIEDINFGNELSPRLGIEAEFLMPLKNNKWTVVIEPTYQSFKSKKNDNKVDYRSIELPVGIRHYFFLNKNSKLFINASYITHFSNNSKIEFSNGANLEIEIKNNMAFGFGHKINDKYSLELRYIPIKEIMTEHYAYKTNYTSLSLIFGYTIF